MIEKKGHWKLKILMYYEHLNFNIFIQIQKLENLKSKNFVGESKFVALRAAPTLKSLKYRLIHDMQINQD